MKYQPSADITSQQRQYDRELPEDNEELDEEELERRAIVRAVKRGTKIPECYDD